tara:strand:+ start:96 stop:308 length:213 start_codon:yes stop_codon:yes gene_type:complete
MQNNQVSSRGRVIKKTGLDDKKINALNEIKNAQKGGAGARRLDQFKVSYKMPIRYQKYKFSRIYLKIPPL